MLHTSEAHYTPRTQSSPPEARAILVATDGTHDADGAVRVGRALALRDDVPIDLLSVVEPVTMFTPDGVPIPGDAHELTVITREAREASLLSQRDRTHPGIHTWPFTVEVGPRFETI